MRVAASCFFALLRAKKNPAALSVGESVVSRLNRTTNCLLAAALKEYKPRKQHNNRGWYTKDPIINPYPHLHLSSIQEETGVAHGSFLPECFS